MENSQAERLARWWNSRQGGALHAWEFLKTEPRDAGAFLFAKPAPSRQFLHHDAVALNLVQLKLDRGGRLGRLRIGCLDRPENLALGAMQDDASAVLHPAGEFAGCVFAGAAAGRHAPKIGMRAGQVESVNRTSTIRGATSFPCPSQLAE